MSNLLGRLAIINAALAAAIGFLVMNGYFVDAFFGTAKYPCWVLLSLTAIALTLMFFRHFEDAKWISNHMTRFGMIGTLIGMIQGLSSLEFTTADVAAMATQLAQHTGYAFYSTLFGVLGNIWLNFNLRFFHTDE